MEFTNEYKGRALTHLWVCHSVEGVPGHDVTDVIAELVQLAKDTGDSFTPVLNGCGIVATPTSEVSTVLGAWRAKTEPPKEEEKEAEPTHVVIREEDHIHDAWYKRAAEIRSIQELVPFLSELAHEYNHDYGTVCHALAAGAVATCWALNRESPSGGITGFQAGAVMWEFIRAWNGLKGPAQLTRYQDMLYPQYERRFKKVIHKGTWEWLRDRAAEELSQASRSAADTVVAHWKSIVDGVVPFGYTVEDD